MAGLRLVKNRSLLSAGGADVQTPISKTAADKGLIQCRHAARNRGQALPPLVGVGQGIEQIHRIGMAWPGKEICRLRHFNDLAGIHQGHPMCHL